MRSGETRDERVKRLLQFQPHVDMVFHDIAAFHEWNVELAVAKFKAKTDNGKPVIMFTFLRMDGISVLETPWEGPDEKVTVMHVVREACATDPGVRMMSTINEVWIAAEHNTPENPDALRKFSELRRQYKEVRHMPGREDGLMVVTYERGGNTMATRWVVKLKHNPANNRMLARDDIDMTKEGGQMYGQHFGYFEPEKEIPV